jgi:anaerobic selenocysteine-containing dehydrogenase
VLGDSTHKVSRGYTCEKGRNIVKHYSSNRLSHPLFNQEKVSWEQSLPILAKKIQDMMAESGSDSIGLYLGTNAILDSTTAWSALGFMYSIESRNIYTVSSIDAVNKTLANDIVTSGVMPGLIPQIDYERADCVLLVGTNPLVSHGHLAGLPFPGKRLRDLTKRGGSLIVADPRKTETASLATLHIDPTPGTDFLWLGYVIAELYKDRNSVDHQFLEKHTEGINPLIDILGLIKESDVLTQCRISKNMLDSLIQTIGFSKSFSAVTGTGVSFSSSGVVTEFLVWVLNGIKGSIDRPGGLWFNLGLKDFLNNEIEENNSENSYNADTIFSHRMPKRRELPSRAWERPVAGLADEIMAGNLRLLFCVGGNPLSAFPDLKKTKIALEKLECLVVLDTHVNELTDLADFALPVLSPLERWDCSAYVSSSAPMPSLQVCAPSLPPHGDSMAGWKIFSSLGDFLGRNITKTGRLTADIDDRDMLRTVADFGTALEKFPNLPSEGVALLGEKQFGQITKRLPNNKWKFYSKVFLAEWHKALFEINQLEQTTYLLMINMREESHLNSTFPSAIGSNESPEIHLNVLDAQILDLTPGDLVSVSVENERLIGKLVVSDKIKVGVVAIPHGYSNHFSVTNLISSSIGVNSFTSMPQQNGIPVKIHKLQ